MTLALQTIGLSPTGSVTVMRRFGFIADAVSNCAPVSDRSTSVPGVPSI